MPVGYAYCRVLLMQASSEVSPCKQASLRPSNSPLIVACSRYLGRQEMWQCFVPRQLGVYEFSKTLMACQQSDSLKIIDSVLWAEGYPHGQKQPPTSKKVTRPHTSMRCQRCDLQVGVKDRPHGRFDA
jgi:hypothetical protein